jgi:hypothetical protein
MGSGDGHAKCRQKDPPSLALNTWGILKEVPTFEAVAEREQDRRSSAR